MLRFFRINDPYRLVFIFLILIIVRIVQSYFIPETSSLELKWLLLGQWLGNGFLMYRETYDYTGPFAALIYKYIDIVFGRSAFVHHVLSSFLIIIQASIFNRVLLKNKAFDENSYLPAFLFVILMLSIPDFMSLSPQLMSLTFVLITLGNVLRRIDNQATDELFLNSGIYIGVATMFYLPAIIFLLVFLVSFIIFSTAVSRRLLLYLFGFFLVGGMTAIYFFWRGDYDYFISFFIKYGFLLSAERMLSWQEIFVVSIPILTVLLLATFRNIAAARLTNFQQRVQQVLWLMFLGGIICFLLANRKTAIELIFIVPLVAYYLNQYFILLRNRIFRFIMPGLIVFGILAYNIYSYQKLFKPVANDLTIGYNHKVLILGEEYSYYLDKESFSPCFSRAICEQAFKGLDYYQSSTFIYKWLEELDPLIIVDQMEVVPMLFERFPLLETNYVLEGDGTYIKINN